MGWWGAWELLVATTCPTTVFYVFINLLSYCVGIMIHYIMNTKKEKTVSSLEELTVSGEENKQTIHKVIKM